MNNIKEIIKSQPIDATTKYFPKVLNYYNQKINYLIHISDIHIERNDLRKDEYQQVLKNLCDKIESFDLKNALICILGDITDFKGNISSQGTEMLINFLVNLSNLHPIILIPGNHDVSLNSPNATNLLSCFYNKLKTNNIIYYLNKTGVYQYNNILFAVTSVYDNILIKPDQIIKTNDDDKLVFLHHGFVYTEKIDVLRLLRKHDHIKLQDIEGYDFGLLGDIHQNLFLNDHIAYCSSLLQRNHGETYDGHGFILWHVNDKLGQFIEIPNDFGFIEYKFVDNKLVQSPKKIPKYSRVKVKHTNTNDNVIEKFIDNLKIDKKILSVVKENIFTFDNMKIKVSNKETIQKLDVMDSKNIMRILNNYLNKNDKLDRQTIKNVLKLHNKYYKKVDKIVYQAKNIKFLRIIFDGMFCYGDGNELDFTKYNLCGIIAPNHLGKSSIIDIICYVLFDKTVRTDRNNLHFMNVRKRYFYVELELTIDNNHYLIKRYCDKRRVESKTRSVDIFRLVDGKYKNVGLINYTDKNKYIQDLIGLTYEDFLFSVIMTQDTSTEILKVPNNKRKKIINNFLKIDFFDKIYEHVKKGINQKEALIKKSRIEIEEYKEEKDELENFKESKEQVEKKFNEINKNINNKKNQIEKMQDRIKHIDGINNISNIDEEISRLEKDLNDINKKIMKLDDDIKLNEKDIYSTICTDKDVEKLEAIVINKFIDKINVEKQTEELKKYKTNIEGNSDVKQYLINLMTNNIDGIKKKNDNMLELIKRKNNLEKNRLEKQNKLDIMNKNKIVISNNLKVKEKIKELKKTLNNYMEKKTQIEINLDIVKRKEINYEMIKKRLKKLYLNVKDTEEELRLLNIYLEATSPKGVKLYIFNMISQTLEDNMNNILRRFSDVQVKIKVDYSGHGNIDIIKCKNGDELTTSTTSSFENMSINLSFKIALNELSNNSSISFMILDEITSCIDSQNLEKVDRVFDYLKERYDSVLCVSHIDSIQDKFDDIIHIAVDKDGFSKLML